MTIVPWLPASGRFQQIREESSVPPPRVRNVRYRAWDVNKLEGITKLDVHPQRGRCYEFSAAETPSRACSHGCYLDQARRKTRSGKGGNRRACRLRDNSAGRGRRTQKTCCCVGMVVPRSSALDGHFICYGGSSCSSSAASGLDAAHLASRIFGWILDCGTGTPATIHRKHPHCHSSAHASKRLVDVRAGVEAVGCGLVRQPSRHVSFCSMSRQVRALR